MASASATATASAADASPHAPAAPAAPAASAVTGGVSRAGAAFFALHLLTWLAAAAQLFIDASYDNIVCTALALTSASVTLLYIRSTRALVEVPLSTAALLGLCVTTVWGALLAQAALGDSLTRNLLVPLQTFGYLLVFQLVAVASHAIYRRLAFFVAARQLGASLLSGLGIFRVPPVQAIWAIGAIGFLGTFGSQAGEGNLLSKVAGGLSVLAWAPFVIPLLATRLGPAYCRMRVQVPLLLVFVAAAVLLGVALNARSVMLAGAMTGGLLFLLDTMADERPLQARQLRYLAIALLVCGVLYKPVNVLVEAVGVVRGERDKVERVELMRLTLEAFVDLWTARPAPPSKHTGFELDAYSEYYFRSNTLGRLLETKFHDNGFYMVQGVSPVERRMLADDVVDRVWAILPYPVLKFLGLERSKLVNLYSVGDLLSHLRLGDELGSFRTGSMFAQATALFGLWAPFLYFPACLLLFLAWDILARTPRGAAAAAVSVIGMLLVYRVFAFGLVAESINTIPSLLLRNQLQTLLLYALVYAATRLIWKPFDPQPDPDAASGAAAGTRAP